MKLCRACGEFRPITDFRRDKSRADGLMNRCRPCDRIYQAKRRQRPDVQEALRAYRREWRDRPEVRERYVAVYWPVYRARHPEKIRAAWLKWAANNPEKMKTYWRCKDYRRRQQLRQTGRISYERAAIYERDGGRCHICLDHVDRQEFTLDHLAPLSQGGFDSPENVAVAHRSCNSRRGAGRIAAQLRLIG